MTPSRAYKNDQALVARRMVPCASPMAYGRFDGLETARVSTSFSRRSSSRRGAAKGLEQILIRHDHNRCGEEVQTLLGVEGGQGEGDSAVQSLD